MRRVIASLLFAIGTLGAVAAAIAAVGALIAAQHFRRTAPAAELGL